MAISVVIRVNAAVAVVNDLLYVIGGSVVMIENNAHPTALNEQYSPLMDQPADN
jgi:Kelch motif